MWQNRGTVGPHCTYNSPKRMRLVIFVLSVGIVGAHGKIPSALHDFSMLPTPENDTSYQSGTTNGGSSVPISSTSSGIISKGKCSSRLMGVNKKSGNKFTQVASSSIYTVTNACIRGSALRICGSTAQVSLKKDMVNCLAPRQIMESVILASKEDCRHAFQEPVTPRTVLRSTFYHQ